jgi:tetratricopeptide (TPR) repeat protein
MKTIKTHKILLKISLLMLGICLLINPKVSAQIEEQKFSLAEGYEQSGDISSAIRLYEEIYQVNKSERYFVPIVRIYKQFNRFAELLPLVEERLKSEQSGALLNLGGELHWRLGNVDAANNLWNKLLKDYADDVQTYINLATTQSILRLYEKSINVLLTGKHKFPQDANLIDLLIKNYINTGNYRDGFTELLSQLELTRNLPQAQSRLYGLMLNDDANEYIENAFNREIKRNENVFTLNLYCWYLRLEKKFEKALDITVKIDNAKKAKGNEIYRFADESKRDGEYEVAIMAFQIVISMGKDSPYMMSAVYQVTKTMEEQLLSATRKNNNTDIAKFNKLIADYKKIIVDFPNTENSEQSKLRVAFIEHTILKHKTAAIEMLQSIITTNIKPLFVAQAMNELADIYVEIGELDKANQTINELQIKYKQAAKSNAEMLLELNKSRFNQAEVLYYLGKTDSALALYYELTESLDDDIANDALERITFISQNSEFVRALSLFAEAEYLSLQTKYSEALNNYYEIIKIEEGEQIAENAIIKVSEIEIKYNNNSANARTILINYITNNIYPLYGDNALFMLGQISEQEKDNAAAMNYYADILVKYPRSILISDARRRIRELRSE